MLGKIRSLLGKEKEKSSVKKEELLSLIDREKMPKHIAIVMDGNGRWANSRGLPRVAGHKVGVDALHRIVDECTKLDIKVLTVYVFSTENWQRPEAEVNFLMRLLEARLPIEAAEMHKNNVRLGVIGRVEELPDYVQKTLDDAIELTKNNTGLILNLALNYGGRAEIVDAAKEIFKKIEMGEISLDEINDQHFEQNIYTKGQPPVDLLIRTGGDYRVSNFLLWQIAYAEIWVTRTNWPEFKPKNLLQAIVDFQRRERRFGGLVSESDKGDN